MAMRMIRAVLKETGVTATCGIGTNLYLAKVAMDIVAKKSPADKDGVRIAELNEDSYKYLLWDHRPLTDFWQIGPGKARRLARGFMSTMGEIADRSLYDEEWFYKTFGIDAEILIDHAWGIEPVTMRDIKSYRSDSHSLSNGQVLPRPYRYGEARIVFSEMIEGLCADMFMKNLVSPAFTWWVSYDYKSLEACPSYDGPLTIDFYGRLQLLFRRLGICANMTSADDGIYQLNLFTDYDALEREKSIQRAMLTVRRRYGPNAIFTGKDLLEGATTLERNLQIGGHKA